MGCVNGHPPTPPPRPQENPPLPPRAPPPPPPHCPPCPFVHPGIEVVKCSAWEAAFMGRIGAARARELAMLWKVGQRGDGGVGGVGCGVWGRGRDECGDVIGRELAMLWKVGWGPATPPAAPRSID